MLWYFSFIYKIQLTYNKIKRNIYACKKKKMHLFYGEEKNRKIILIFKKAS